MLNKNTHLDFSQSKSFSAQINHLNHHSLYYLNYIFIQLLIAILLVCTNKWQEILIVNKALIAYLRFISSDRGWDKYVKSNWTSVTLYTWIVFIHENGQLYYVFHTLLTKQEVQKMPRSLLIKILQGETKERNVTFISGSMGSWVAGFSVTSGPSSLFHFKLWTILRFFIRCPYSKPDNSDIVSVRFSQN